MPGLAAAAEEGEGEGVEMDRVDMVVSASVIGSSGGASNSGNIGRRAGLRNRDLGKGTDLNRMENLIVYLIHVNNLILTLLYYYHLHMKF